MEGVPLRLTATATESGGACGFKAEVRANFVGIGWAHHCDHTHRTWAAAETCAPKIAKHVRAEAETSHGAPT
jgi:hypothetical protein